MVSVLAASKLWYPDLVLQLQKRTGMNFVTVSQPAELNEDFLQNLNPSYIFFSHWSHLIPADIYQRFECIVFHMTDLPFGRGGSPLQNLIARGIYQTQISALRCEEGLDSGPIYLKKPLSLVGRAQEIYQQASRVIEDMVVDIIQQKLSPLPQQGEVVKFQRRKPEESNLALLNELTKVYDYIRMLDADQYPKAFIETEHLKFEFSRAVLQGDELQANVSIKLKRKENA